MFCKHVFRENVKMRGEITGTTPVAKATVVPRDAAQCVSVCVAVRVCPYVCSQHQCVRVWFHDRSSHLTELMCEPLCPEGAGGESGVAPCVTPSTKGDDQMRSLKAFLRSNNDRHLSRDDKEWGCWHVRSECEKGEGFSLFLSLPTYILYTSFSRACWIRRFGLLWFVQTCFVQLVTFAQVTLQLLIFVIALFPPSFQLVNSDFKTRYHSIF